MYNYQKQRPELFTESGVEMLIKIRENVRVCIAKSGAVRATEAWCRVTGDMWTMAAALDYLVEIKVIREITDSSTWGQYRVFVANEDGA